MGRVHQLLLRFDFWYGRIRTRTYEKRKIRDPKRRRILSSYVLTKEQKGDIDKFYLANYGKRVPYSWHRYYSSYTGNFDVKYIPELLFIPEIEKSLVSRDYANAISDKNLLPYLVAGIPHARTAQVLVSCANGNYRNCFDLFISRSEAIELLQNAGEVFFKPARDSNSGRNCILLDLRDGKDRATGKAVSDILSDYGKDFIAQEVIKPSEQLARLHPQSVNTLRIVTYIWKGKVFHFPVILRMGLGQSVVDNSHQGGIFIGVDDEGNLLECAFSEFQDRYHEHPNTGVVFKGYFIPGVPLAIETVKAIHQRIPHTGIVSWDVTIGKQEEIVIVEINLLGQSIWGIQMAHGRGAFGENTEEILRSINHRIHSR